MGNIYRASAHTYPLFFVHLLVDVISPALVFLFINIVLIENKYSSLYLFSGLWLSFSIFVQGGYKRQFERNLSRELELYFKAWMLFIFGVSLKFYISKNVSSLDFPFLAWLFFTPFFCICIQTLTRKILAYYGKEEIAIAILGKDYKFLDLEIDFLTKQNIKLYFFDLEGAQKNDNAISNLKPSHIVLNSEDVDGDSFSKTVVKLGFSGVSLLTLHDFMEVYLRKVYISYDTLKIDHLEKLSTYTGFDLFLKRFIDIFCSILLLVVTSPIILLSIILIKKESPGPIIFSQSRVVKYGKERTIYKFRSMHLNAEKNGAQFASKNDPRAYKFGALMRKTRIDELPQLWNVILGDLHFVGPRPERKIFTDELENKIPYYNERHIVNPGITGWAQVMYPYGENSEDSRQKLMYDLYYIKNWSIWLEIETMVRTVSVILGRKGL